MDNRNHRLSSIVYRLSSVIWRLAMGEPPAGTVTFLFTDIEGSTKRWEQYPQQMRHALSRHNDILSEAITSHGGHVFKTVGDAFCSAFAAPTEALQAALAAQRGLLAEDWPQE